MSAPGLDAATGSGGDRDTLPSLDRPLSRGLCLILAGIYATLLALLPVYEFQDRINYRNYAEDSANIFAALWSLSPAAALFNEPIWLLINSVLGAVFPADTVIRIIVFTGAFGVSYPMFRHSGKYWPYAFIFLTFPSVIKNHIIHLRQGLALGIFLPFYFMGWPRARWAGTAISAFVHSSMFLVGAIMLFDWLLRRMQLAIDVRALGYFAAGLIFAFGLGFLATTLGARQAEAYEFASSSGSGVAFVFWAIIAALYASAPRAFTRQNSLAIAAMLFYLATYFFLEVTARIFESMLAIVLLSSLQLPSKRRLFFLASFSVFSVSFWLNRLGQPALGF